MGDVAQPARGFVHVLEGEPESAVMHRDEPARAQIFEDFHGFVGAHVDVAEGFGVVSANGQQGNFRRAVSANILEAVEIGAVARVINAAALVLQDKTAIAAMIITQDASAPVLAGGQCDFPVAMREGFPPFQFDDAAKAKIMGEIADTPGHDADFGMGQATKGGFVEMIKMGVGQQDQVDGWEMLDAEAGALDTFEEEKPVGEVRIDQDVEIVELDEERGMANPGHGYLTFRELRERGLAMLSGSPGQQGFPNHLAKKGARIEMFGRG